MIQRITDIPVEAASSIVERPDGFYWIDADGGAEFGPFSTRALAVADMLSGAGPDSEPEEILEEFETELGISDWIDPETGELAENSVPHLED
jgi:hypothetical protein